MSKRSILVVDDDKNTRDYLATFLTASGYAVECLESGDQAIQRLAAGHSPSMILLDIMLPGKDGIEVLSNVKAIYPTIPIIILSGIGQIDRKSTRLNSSHSQISYAVFCLKKKKNKDQTYHTERSQTTHASVAPDSSIIHTNQLTTHS